jgi:hypothetical protein
LAVWCSTAAFFREILSDPAHCLSATEQMKLCQKDAGMKLPDASIFVLKKMWLSGIL